MRCTRPLALIAASALVACGGGGPGGGGGSGGGGSSASERGVYVISEKLASARNNLPLWVYQAPYIDGTIITGLWNQIETAPGTYNWSAIDNEINNAVASNKKLVIQVTAGGYAPSWLYSAPYNVANGTWLWGAQDCASGGTSYQMPVPWDPNYLTRFSSIMSAFAAHLQSIPGAYDAVVRVRITGANTLTDELHLGYCASMTGPTGTQLWQSLGYTPNNVISGVESMIASTRAAFPGKVLSLSILKTGDLPLINNAGAIITSTSDLTYVDVAQTVIDYALTPASGIAGKFAVQWNGFFQVSGASAKVISAGAAGAIVGWQTNEFGGKTSGAECPDANGYPVICTSATYQTLLDAMISTANGQYLEIFPANVVQFPAAITQAQQALAAGGD